MTIESEQETSPPPPRDHTEAPQPIGENLLDALCIKYGGQPQGLIMYDDRLKTNIIEMITRKAQLSKNRLMSSTIPGYIFSNEKKPPKPG